MDLTKYGEIISVDITNREELVKHFTDKIAYFIIVNDFGDGPSLSDLLNEMLDLNNAIVSDIDFSDDEPEFMHPQCINCGHRHLVTDFSDACQKCGDRLA